MAADIVCQVLGKPAQISFIWSDGPASFPPYELTGNGLKKFRDLARQAREQLSNLVKDYLHGADEDVRRSSFELARVGHKLYRQIFLPAAEQRELADKIGKWLSEMRDHDAIESLEFVVDGLDPVPWNVVYEREPDEAAFLSGSHGMDHWLSFWGIRYNLAGGRRVEPLRRLPWLKSPGLRLLMVVDPEIRRGLPEDQQRRLEGFLRARSLTAIESRDQLAEALEDERPDLMYWLCHASPSALELGGEPIRPADLAEMLQGAAGNRFGGLAFLNACQTAEASEEVGSFLDALHEEGFSGIVATEHQTVDTFAHPFGLDFLEAFLDTGEPIGKLLQQLRGRGVPLGLLYGTYCPPGLYVRRAAAATAGPADIAAAPRLAGVALGATAELVATQKRVTPLPEEPYRSLAYYDREHRALFVGRDDDAQRFALILDDPKTRLLVLHGESGVGKSSFLRAGVIPYLEEECVGYRFLRDRTVAEDEPPSLFIRATNDPAGQLAKALCVYCARPVTDRAPDGTPVEIDLPRILAEPLGRAADPVALREALRSDATLLGRLLSDLAGRLPHNLVLVIDQVEEIFTLARTPEDAESRRLALEMLRQAIPAQGDFKLILALRTEFYGRLVDGLRRGTRNLGGVREYLLTDFDAADLVAAIRRPTSAEPIPSASETPFSKYRFRYAEGVPESIARGVLTLRSTRQDSVLPLVQVICTQLYERVQVLEDRTIAAEDLEAIGGVRGGMRRHAEGLLERILPGGPGSDRPAFRRLFTQLYLRQPDGALSTALVVEDELSRRWTGRMPFGELISLASAGQTRLLRVNTLRIGDQDERRYVSLGHDALAKVAADWDEELSRGARVRKFVAALAGVSAVAAAMLVLAVIAWQQADVARRNQKEAEASRRVADARRHEFQLTSANLALDRGLSLCEQGEVDHGMLWLARSLEIAPREATDLRRVIRANLAAWQTQLRHLDAIFQHDKGVRAVAFSPDGRTVLTGSFDKTARLWDAATGAPRSEPLVLHSEPVIAVAYRPDGKVFATGSVDGSAHLWDAITSRPVGQPMKHESYVTAVAFSSDSKIFLTGSWDKTVRLWDAATGRSLGEPLKQGDHVKDAALSPDGKTILIGGWGRAAQLWDIAEGGPRDVPTLRHSEMIAAVAFSPDSRTCVTGGYEATVRVWSVSTGTLIRELVHPHAGIESVAFSPDGRFLLTGGLDGAAWLWDVATGRPLGTPIKHQSWIPAIAFSPDGKRILTGSGDKTARLWEFRTDDSGSVLAHKDWVRSVAFSPDGRSVLTGSSDKTARLWDAATGSSRGEPLVHDDAVAAVAFSPDGKLVLTGSFDNTARLWDATTTRPVGEPLHGHGTVVNCVAFSPDGTLALTGGGDRTARLWDVATQRLVGKPLTHQDYVPAANFHPDGRSFVTGSYGGTVQVWDAVTLQPLDPPMLHPNTVWSVVYSPDGKTLATGCEDGTARLWDAATRRCVGEPLQHSSPVWSVAFSPDGTTLLTGELNGSARLWDLRTAKPVGTPFRHLANVCSVAYRHDGRAILTGSWDSTARIWPVPPPPV
ncbi:MAG TPA: AAA family ATPase, partial [Isosphaeraceae bacterium]